MSEGPPNSKASGCDSEAGNAANDNKNYTHTDEEVKSGPLSRSRIITVHNMLDFDREADPDSVYGMRWLCRGKQFGLQAPTGVGKSSLVMGWSIASCLGETIFDVEGLAPREPLRVLILQAETMKAI